MWLYVDKLFFYLLEKIIIFVKNLGIFIVCFGEMKENFYNRLEKS